MAADWTLAGALPVVIDMQRLFIRPGRWGNPDALSIAETIRRVIAACDRAPLFTRFVVPRHAHEAKGCWRAYYEHWHDYTGANLADDSIGIVDELADLVVPALVFDKQGHSAFDSRQFVREIAASGADTLVLMGIETDVCVLATALAAVDSGYRVLAVADAMASSSSAGHDATIAHVLPRFDQQIRVAETNVLLGELVA